MIVCWRRVRIPPDGRGQLLAWIEENRALRQQHGILFELVLERSARQNPAKTLQPTPADLAEDVAVVVTAWASHDAFDRWIHTPDRDRLTASDAHEAVEFRPLVRYDTVGGYLNIDGLSAVADNPKENQ